MEEQFDKTYCKSASNSSKIKRSGNPKPKRGQANRRERVRTENVNVGFENLRKLIPTDPEDRKLSKIEVLRLATSYINHLYNLTRANSCLEAEANDANSCQSSSEEEDSNEVVILEDEQDSKRKFVGTNLDLNPTAKSNDRTITKNHVCTFCLMMTKTTTTTTLTSSGSTKRK